MTGTDVAERPMHGETQTPASKKHHRLAKAGRRPGRRASPVEKPTQLERPVPVEPALNRLLERLLADTMWLREQAESEGFIAERTKIPKSSVREAAIALIKVGCLKRTPDGLLRDTLNADR